MTAYAAANTEAPAFKKARQLQQLQELQLEVELETTELLEQKPKQLTRQSSKSSLLLSVKKVPVPSEECEEICSVLHQFGYVEGEYDRKTLRLQQLLDRLPANSGSVVVFVEPSSAATATAAVERSRRKAASLSARAMSSSTPRKVASPCSATSGISGPAGAMPSPEKAEDPGQLQLDITVIVVAGPTDAAPEVGVCQYVINYDMPFSSKEYLRRLAPLRELTGKFTDSQYSQMPRVVYSFIEEPQLKTRRVREIRALLLRAKRAALEFPQLGGVRKVTEFDSVLEQLVPAGEETSPGEEQDSNEDAGEECDCAHCAGCMLGGMSFHSSLQPSSSSRGEGKRGPPPGVEVVRVHLRTLEDLEANAHLIAPRLPGHVGTLICLHCLNVHTPWDGSEHLFVSSELGGTLRVVLLLADGCSWHDYPDKGTLGAGGVSWMDILDVDSMERADKLLEKLVDHEAMLLGGQSERVVLMGMSQGGGQSMLRFLRSRRRLGGWIGSVCHAPTAPHTPRDRDPLLAIGRSMVNCDRPMRLLAGEEDNVFTPGLILRDADRLRSVGGFMDVEVEVQKGMSHDGVREEVFEPLKGNLTGLQAKREAIMRQAQMEVPELLFVQRQLPMMLGVVPPVTPDAC